MRALPCAMPDPTDDAIMCDPALAPRSPQGNVVACCEAVLEFILSGAVTSPHVLQEVSAPAATQCFGVCAHVCDTTATAARRCARGRTVALARTATRVMPGAYDGGVLACCCRSCTAPSVQRATLRRLRPVAMARLTRQGCRRWWKAARRSGPACESPPRRCAVRQPGWCVCHLPPTCAPASWHWDPLPGRRRSHHDATSLESYCSTCLTPPFLSLSLSLSQSRSVISLPHA